jgi:hypothetical protein
MLENKSGSEEGRKGTGITLVCRHIFLRRKQKTLNTKINFLNNEDRQKSGHY